MIPILIGLGVFLLWEKTKQDASQPMQSPVSGISHIYGAMKIPTVTERQPPWGDTTHYDFGRTVDPGLPVFAGGSGLPSAGAVNVAVPASQLRFPAGIAKVSSGGGGGGGGAF